MKQQVPTFLKIPIKDFAKKIICDGHVYISNADGRKFYVMKPGILLDSAFVKKHALANSVFDFEPVTNEKVLNKFAQLFRELRYLQFEKDLRMKGLEIITYFHEVYRAQEHLLTFAMAAFQEFSHLPKEVVEKMHETDAHLFRKAMYSASLSIIIALSNDFYHFMMLRDFYTLTMYLDYGLCEANYSYFVALACNQENRHPGSGSKLLVEEHASEFEKDNFFNHPRKSYDFFKGPDVLAHRELSEVALYQHELSDGTGFPRGIPKGQVSSWEAVVILADAMIEIQDKYDFENNVIEYLVNFQNKKMSELPVSRVFQKMCLAFQHLEKLKETGS